MPREVRRPKEAPKRSNDVRRRRRIATNPPAGLHPTPRRKKINPKRALPTPFIPKPERVPKSIRKAVRPRKRK